jgi:hypothetical protein
LQANLITIQNAAIIMHPSLLVKYCLAIFGFVCISFSPAQPDYIPDDISHDEDYSAPASVRLARTFECFSPLDGKAVYSISICADIPDDNDPDRVYYKKETGHVFLILQKTDSSPDAKSMTQVFGFYPRRPVSSIVFKTVRCDILDNSKRRYNVSLTREINADEFRFLLQTAADLARKRYNLNRYNCYDYAVEVFNALPGIDKLPVTHVRFPLIFGKGGSPCSLYRDLEKLKANGSVWAPAIQFGDLRAPASYRNPFFTKSQ